MPISEQEQRDLDAAKARVAEIKDSTFDLMREYARMSSDELKHSGHKTNEGAVFSSLKNALKDIDKVWAAHIRKYPD